MKILITIILTAIFYQLYAPPVGSPISREESYKFQLYTNPVYRIYYPLIKAIVYVESRGNDSAYNEKEGAKGRYQVRACRLNEYNKLTGKGYSHDEMFNRHKSLEVFMYYIKGRDYETISRAWAGGESGTKKATNNYWCLVQKALDNEYNLAII